jgi:hypothetical protein
MKMTSHVLVFSDEEWELIHILPDSGSFQNYEYDDTPKQALGETILEQRILEECWRNRGVYCDECLDKEKVEPCLANKSTCYLCGKPIIRIHKRRDFTEEIADLKGEEYD